MNWLIFSKYEARECHKWPFSPQFCWITANQWNYWNYFKWTVLKKRFFLPFFKGKLSKSWGDSINRTRKLTVAPDCNAFLKPWQPIKLFNKRELLKKELCWKEAYLLILVQWPRKKMRFITESVKWSRVVKSSDVDICNQRPNNLKCWNSEKWTLLKIRSFIYRL